MLGDCFIAIAKRIGPLGIHNNGDFVLHLWVFIKQEFFHFLRSAIIWHIIHVDNMVFGVVLPWKSSQVVIDGIFIVVVPSSTDNADWKFLINRSYFVFGMVVFVLSLVVGFIIRIDAESVEEEGCGGRFSGMFRIGSVVPKMKFRGLFLQLLHHILYLFRC